MMRKFTSLLGRSFDGLLQNAASNIDLCSSTIYPPTSGKNGETAFSRTGPKLVLRVVAIDTTRLTRSYIVIMKKFIHLF